MEGRDETKSVAYPWKYPGSGQGDCTQNEPTWVRTSSRGKEPLASRTLMRTCPHEGERHCRSDGWSQRTTLLPADHHETLRTGGIAPLSSPSPIPYGSILSFTGAGLD